MEMYHVDPWRANTLRALAINGAQTPEELAVAQTLPIYPMPQQDMVWTLHRQNCGLAEENGWALGQIDALNSENEALRRQLDALRSEADRLRSEADALRAQNSRLFCENRALLGAGKKLEQ